MSKKEEYMRGFDDGVDEANEEAKEEAKEADERPIDNIFTRAKEADRGALEEVEERLSEADERHIDDLLTQLAKEADERPIETIKKFCFPFTKYEIPEHLEALTESEAYQEGKEAGVKYYHDHNPKLPSFRDMSNDFSSLLRLLRK